MMISAVSVGVVQDNMPVRLRVFVGADCSREEVSTGLAFGLLRGHIGEQPILGRKGFTHQCRAEVLC